MSKIKVYLLVLLVAVIVPAAFYIADTMHEKVKMYHYDTTKSYVYDFHESRAHQVPVSVENGKINLKGSIEDNSTVFLKIDTETSWLGRYLQPSIEIVGAKSSLTQYFERGAKGTRYINISSLTKSGVREIRLKEHHISFSEDKVALISFPNRKIGKRKILVLSPHPDDAEIAAYGLYSDYGRQTYIVTVTAGDAGRFKYNEIYKDKVRHYLKKGELRTWDSITVPLLGGVPPEHIVNLGFFDLSLQKMYQHPSEEVAGYYTGIADIATYRKQNISKLAKGLKGNSSWHSLVNNLVYLLETIQPDIIVTPYPALDTHPDHKFTTIALVEALKKANIRKGELFLYSNHFLYNEYYPYGKAGGTISLPPHFKNDIYFDSIYSYPLSMIKQKDKLFALEAMHDLRLDTEWRFPRYPIKLFKKQIEKRIEGKNKSYFKRSVRSDELFFIIDIDNIYDENILGHLKGKL
jgi:LmbE family N-acetylglucosaminyl deacetylase